MKWLFGPFPSRKEAIRAGWVLGFSTQARNNSTPPINDSPHFIDYRYSGGFWRDRHRTTCQDTTLAWAPNQPVMVMILEQQRRGPDEFKQRSRSVPGLQVDISISIESGFYSTVVKDTQPAVVSSAIVSLTPRGSPTISLRLDLRYQTCNSSVQSTHRTHYNPYDQLDTYIKKTRLIGPPASPVLIPIPPLLFCQNIFSLYMYFPV